MIAAVDKVKKILESQFEIKSYVELVKEVFASVKIISPDNFRKESSNFSSHIKSSSHVGSYEDRDGKRLAIFAVELKKDAYVERSRSTQRSFAKNSLKMVVVMQLLLLFLQKMTVSGDCRLFV